MSRRWGIVFAVLMAGLLISGSNAGAVKTDSAANPGAIDETYDYEPLYPEVQLELERLENRLSKQINESKKNLEDYERIIEIKADAHRKVVENRLSDYRWFAGIIVALLGLLLALGGKAYIRYSVGKKIDAKIKEVMDDLKPEGQIQKRLDEFDKELSLLLQQKAQESTAKNLPAEEMTQTEKEIINKAAEERKKKPEAEYTADDYFLWGYDAGMEGKHEKAVEHYQQATEKEPNNYVAWNNKGYALSDLERYEEAMAAYDKAIEIKSDFHEAWYNKGDALFDLERYEEALTAYDKAIEIKSDFHEAWNNKGYALSDLERYEEALTAYDKAIEIKPDYPNVWKNKGLALAGLGRYKEAIKACNKAIQIKPDFSPAYYNLACIYSLKEDKAKALEYLEIAIDKGYDKLKHIEQDKELDFIRDDPEYKRIIKKLKAKKNL